MQLSIFIDTQKQLKSFKFKEFIMICMIKTNIRLIGIKMLLITVMFLYYINVNINEEVNQLNLFIDRKSVFDFFDTRL